MNTLALLDGTVGESDGLWKNRTGFKSYCTNYCGTERRYTKQLRIQEVNTGILAVNGFHEGLAPRLSNSMPKANIT